MSPTPTAEIKPGDRLDGKYDIVRRIGAGGMGAVFLAKRVALDDLVAVKCVQHNTAANRARFVREAKAAARIRHPNVVQVFDFGDTEGAPPYMVMEYLEGPTLAEELSRVGRLPIDRALTIFGAICAAIEAGHRRGVVHRDLKPGNVILARSDDGRETVKVLDFGLARLTDSTSMALTSPGSLLGTCSYMAPEQIEGSTGDTASDVFSLGVMLYELTTGSLPFSGATPIQAMMRIAEGRFVPAREVVPSLPDMVVNAIESALRTDPAQRPAGAEILALLAGCATARATAAPFEPAPEPNPRERGDDTILHAGDDGSLEKGPEETIVADLRSELAAARSAVEDVFVGRTPQLAALRDELEACRRGAGRITIVDGAAGVGKTRLVEHFLTTAQQSGAAVFRGRFFAYEGDRPPPYELFSWMLNDGSASFSRPGGLGPASRKLELGDDRWQAFAHLADAFVARARGRPIVFALDDIQWATALDLEFLTYAPRGRALMVVATARNDATRPDARTELSRFIVKLSNQRMLSRLPVEPFSEAEVRAFVTATFGAVRIRPTDLRRLSRATGGNPYYLSEVVRRLVHDGKLVRDDDGWRCDPLDAVDLPESVSNVVRAKLETIDPELRKLLEVACVIGEEFRFETLEHASEIDEERLEALLEEGVRVGLLSEKDLAPGSDFRFETPTIRDVLYADIPNRRRKRLHKTVVESLQSLYSSDGERIAKVLCYHHQAVGDFEQTLEWGLLAAESLARHDVDNALASIERAQEAVRELERTGHPPPRATRARVEFRAGELLDRVGRIDEAGVLLERAAVSAEAIGDRDLLLDVLDALGDCRVGLGRLADAVETGQRAMTIAAAMRDEEPNDAGRMRRAFVTQTHAARYYGLAHRYAEGVALLEPIVEAATREGMDQVASKALRELAYIEIRRGQFKASGAHARQAITLARRCGDERAEYLAMATYGAHLSESGDIAAAIPALEEALEMARRLSLRRREAIELVNLGEAHWLEGKLDRGLERALEALGIMIEIEDRASEGATRVIIGRLLLAKGERAEGQHMLERGGALCRETGRIEYACLADIELGKTLLVPSGEIARGHEILARVREELAELGSLYLWQADFALAEMFRDEGDLEKARAAATSASQSLGAQRAALPGDARALDEQIAKVSKFLAELAS